MSAELLLAPALRSNAIEYEVRQFPQDFHDSVYAGDPSPELDLAWHYLFEGKSFSKCPDNAIDKNSDNNIRVEKHDLDDLGLDSIQLADGGYIAQLGVFHELHCLVHLS